MTDIVAEIATSAFHTKNPAVNDDTEVAEEDTDAAVVPDFFEKVRQYLTTSDPEHQPRRLVRCAQVAKNPTLRC